jgi:hypothetical protein
MTVRSWVEKCGGVQKPWETTSYRPNVSRGQTILDGPSSSAEGEGLRHIYFTARVDYQFFSRAEDLYNTISRRGLMKLMVGHEQVKLQQHIQKEKTKFGSNHIMWVTIFMNTKECNLELKWCLD